MENNNDHANFCIYKKCYNVGCIDMVYNIPDYIKVSILNSSNNNDVHEFSSLIDTNNHEQRIYYLYTFTYNKLICENIILKCIN